MDDIIAIRGVTVTSVRAVGLTQSGQAYVECEFSDGTTGVICFPQGLVQTLPLAFLEAASQLDQEASQAGKTVVAIPVEKAVIHIAQETTQTGALVLALTTKVGSRLNFLLPEDAVDQLIDGIWETLRATGQLDWLN